VFIISLVDRRETGDSFFKRSIELTSENMALRSLIDKSKSVVTGMRERSMVAQSETQTIKDQMKVHLERANTLQKEVDQLEKKVQISQRSMMAHGQAMRHVKLDELHHQMNQSATARSSFGLSRSIEPSSSSVAAALRANSNDDGATLGTPSSTTTATRVSTKPRGQVSFAASSTSSHRLSAEAYLGPNAIAMIAAAEAAAASPPLYSRPLINPNNINTSNNNPGAWSSPAINGSNNNGSQTSRSTRGMPSIDSSLSPRIRRMRRSDDPHIQQSSYNSNGESGDWTERSSRASASGATTNRNISAAEIRANERAMMAAAERLLFLPDLFETKQPLPPSIVPTSSSSSSSSTPSSLSSNGSQSARRARVSTKQSSTSSSKSSWSKDKPNNDKHHTSTTSGSVTSPRLSYLASASSRASSSVAADMYSPNFVATGDPSDDHIEVVDDPPPH
jgi:hypothetical protein